MTNLVPTHDVKRGEIVVGAYGEHCKVRSRQFIGERPALYVERLSDGERLYIAPHDGLVTKAEPSS